MSIQLKAEHAADMGAFWPTEQYEQDELEKYLNLAPGDTRMTGVLASEVVALRSQLAQAKADLEAAQTKLYAVRKYAAQWPRCCDLWQDSMGGMHCVECEQKTFAMLRNVQGALGIRKDGVTLMALRDGGER